MGQNQSKEMSLLCEQGGGIVKNWQAVFDQWGRHSVQKAGSELSLSGQVLDKMLNPSITSTETVLVIEGYWGHHSVQ